MRKEHDRTGRPADRPELSKAAHDRACRSITTTSNQDNAAEMCRELARARFWTRELSHRALSLLACRTDGSGVEPATRRLHGGAGGWPPCGHRGQGAPQGASGQGTYCRQLWPRTSTYLSIAAAETRWHIRA
jgi:hypothetical protein